VLRNSKEELLLVVGFVCNGSSAGEEELRGVWKALRLAFGYLPGTQFS